MVHSLAHMVRGNEAEPGITKEDEEKKRPHSKYRSCKYTNQKYPRTWTTYRSIRGLSWGANIHHSGVSPRRESVPPDDCMGASLMGMGVHPLTP